MISGWRSASRAGRVPRIYCVSILLALPTLFACSPQARESELIDLGELLPIAEVEPAESREQVRRSAEGGFSLPAGVQVDFYFELPEGARLVLDGADALDTEPFDWSLEVEGGPVARLALESAGVGQAASLPGAPGALVRLSVRRRSGEGRSTIRGATVWGVRALEEEEIEVEVVGERSDGRSSARPHVFVYMIDTLRADHLGCYGYDRPTSPEIDAFAESATLYENVVAQSSWTKSTVASLFTGLWPTAHGANRRRDRLSPEASTLAEILDEAGYRTAAFVGNPVAGPDFGFEQGFEHFDLMDRPSAEEVGEAAIAWIDETAESSAPLFIYLHTIEPHMPYRPPEDLWQTWAPQVELRPLIGSRPATEAIRKGELEPSEQFISDTIDLYDAEIAANDRAFGHFLDRLQARGLADDSIVVVISDHGEELHDHGSWSHGRTLYDESIRVPLIIQWPGAEGGGRVTARVAQIDVLPSLLSHLGLPAPEALDGVALADREGRRPLYSLLALSGPPTASILDDRYKLIERTIDAVSIRKLYDHTADPKEREDLSDQMPVRTGYLAQRLRAWRLANPKRWTEEGVTMTPELEAELRALGYL